MYQPSITINYNRSHQKHSYETSLIILTITYHMNHRHEPSLTIDDHSWTIVNHSLMFHCCGCAPLTLVPAFDAGTGCVNPPGSRAASRIAGSRGYATGKCKMRYVRLRCEWSIIKNINKTDLKHGNWLTGLRISTWQLVSSNWLETW